MLLRRWRFLILFTTFSNKVESMIDVRIVLIIIPSLLFWLLFFPSHRHANGRDAVRVNSNLAFFAGSRSQTVSPNALAAQIGALSMIPWYIIFVLVGTSYMVSNAYVLSVLLGGITTLGCKYGLKSR